MAAAARSTANRDRDRKTIRRTKPPCALCGHPIDYTLRHDDPMAFEVDHIIPVSKGGPDVIENKQATHRTCNRRKYDKSDIDLRPAPRTFVTHRAW